MAFPFYRTELLWLEAGPRLLESTQLEEKMRLISFQTRKGQSVIVNSNQVQCISSVGTDSKIEFGPGHSILVTTGVEAVKTMLTDEEGLQTIPEATRS